MQSRWWFSQFYRDTTLQMLMPVCNSYGYRWFVPSYPPDEDGWGLVQMLTTPHQIQAAVPDPRVIIMPQMYDATPLPQAVIGTYAKWGATAGMSFGTLLAKLEETEPTFGHAL